MTAAINATVATIPGQRPAPDDAHTDVRALIDRAQAGDIDAVADIYSRYVDLVFRYVQYRVGNRLVAEDITSEVFVRALKRIGSFTWQGRDLGAWLVTIARNLVVDHFKSGRYRLEVTTAVDLDETGRTKTVEDAAPGHVISAERAHAVRAALAKLPTAEQRTVVRLRYYEQLSVAETARRMGINEGAIKALTYRAIQSLRQLAPELEAHR